MFTFLFVVAESFTNTAILSLDHSSNFQRTADSKSGYLQAFAPKLLECDLLTVNTRASSTQIGSYRTGIRLAVSRHAFRHLGRILAAGIRFITGFRPGSLQHCLLLGPVTGTPPAAGLALPPNMPSECAEASLWCPNSSILLKDLRTTLSGETHQSSSS